MWGLVTVISIVLAFITYVIFKFLYLDPCNAQDNTSNCIDSVTAFLAVPVLLFYFSIGFIIFTVLSFIFSKVLIKSPNTQFGTTVNPIHRMRSKHLKHPKRLPLST
jgi:hypothetical protein